MEMKVIDLAGTTLLPGLMDMHVRLAAPIGSGLGSVRHAPGPRRKLLENGVTSVRSLGDDLTWILKLRRLVAEGAFERPMISTVDGHPTQSLQGGQVIAGLVMTGHAGGVTRDGRGACCKGWWGSRQQGGCGSLDLIQPERSSHSLLSCWMPSWPRPRATAFP